MIFHCPVQISYACLNEIKNVVVLVVVENKTASSLVVSLGKALNGMPPPLCIRQVALTNRKWQPPSECARSVQNIAIQFGFS